MNRVQDFCDKLKMPTVLLSCDEHPIILASNEQHTKLSGFTKEELLGKSPTIFDGKLTSSQTINDIQHSIRTSDFWAGETVNYTKDRTPYRVAVNIIGVVVAGERYYAAVKQKMGLY